jgi:hypothetical protein
VPPRSARERDATESGKAGQITSHRWRFCCEAPHAAGAVVDQQDELPCCCSPRDLQRKGRSPNQSDNGRDSTAGSSRPPSNRGAGEEEEEAAYSVSMEAGAGPVRGREAVELGRRSAPSTTEARVREGNERERVARTDLFGLEGQGVGRVRTPPRYRSYSVTVSLQHGAH